jgi:hypothetical protein
VIGAFLAGALALASADVAIARVGDFVVTDREFAVRVAALRATGRSGSPESVVEGLVAEKLLSDEARRLGAASSGRVAVRIGALERETAVELMFAELRRGAKATDATLLQLFHGVRDQLSYESLVFATKGEAAAAAQQVRDGASLASARGSAVVARLDAEPKDAPRVARSQLDEGLAKALFSAPAGTLVGPLELKNGWAVARARQLEPAPEKDFPAARAELTQIAERMLASEGRKHLVEQLKRSSGATVDEKFLRSLSGGEATPQQLEHVVATAKGHALRYADIFAAVRTLAAGGGHMAGATVKVQLAWQELEGRLLQDVAAERGFLKNAAVTSRRAEFERIALSEEAAARIQEGVPPATDKEVEEFYRTNAGRFQAPLAKVRPQVAEQATGQKRQAAPFRRLEELRKQQRVSVDRDALARAASAIQ